MGRSKLEGVTAVTERATVKQKVFRGRIQNVPDSSSGAARARMFRQIFFLPFSHHHYGSF